MLSEAQSKIVRDFFIVARSLSGGRLSVNHARSTRCDLALRIAAETRWSRADETQKLIAEMELAAQNKLGCAAGLVDTLRGLEFDLARHQRRFARFAADFLCSNPFHHRSDCSIRGLSGTSALVAAARGRLRRPGFDWRSDVRSKLWPPVLG